MVCIIVEPQRYKKFVMVLKYYNYDLIPYTGNQE